MGVPDSIYIGRNIYWHHSYTTDKEKANKLVRYYKKKFKVKYHIITTEDWFGAYKIYHIYFTKIRNLC